MQRVQSVEFGLELQTKLDFFLVRADVLVDLFLQLDTKLDFLVKLLAQLTIIAIDIIQCQLELFFILVELVDLLVEVVLHLFNMVLVLRANLGYQHLVVRLAAVLQQDRVDLPDGGKQRVLVLGVVEALVQHFVKADRVDEEASEDSVYCRNFNICT